MVVVKKDSIRLPMRIQLGQATLQKSQREGVIFIAENTVLFLLTLGNTTHHAVMTLGMGFPASARKGAG